MKFSQSAFLLTVTGLALSNPLEQRANNNSTLNWEPCALDGLPEASQAVVKNASLLCATHTVPLDWTNERNGRTIKLQLIKAKANKEPFRGSVFTQPGGPGGSGVEEIIERGVQYREILGGQWDVIAFDLRGTGRTFPVVCNPVNASSSSLDRRSLNFTLPQAEMWPILKERAWRDGGLYAEACAQTQSVADYASYISTPFAARDMLSIVDALGEDGKLRLWGRSYGTVLAQTFASMFPDRVGRIVADSVVLLSDYYSGSWLNTHRDTEKVVLNFFRECIAVGTEWCPVANFTGQASTPESLLGELGSALGVLLQRSIRLPDTAAVNGLFWQPGSLYLYDIVKYGMFTASYEPTQLVSLLVWANATLNRDWDVLYQLVATPPPNGTTDATPERWNLGQAGAFFGVACSDNEFRASQREDMYSLVQAQQSAASFLDAFGPQVWPCAQWKFKARETFKGPFFAVNTSYPILMINSPQDPITSLGGAWAASANYLGSRLLVHNGHGHGSINHPSNCTLMAIHDYFNEGTLPEVGKVCQPDRSAYEIAIEFLEAVQNQISPLEKRSVGDGLLQNKFLAARSFRNAIFSL